MTTTDRRALLAAIPAALAAAALPRRGAAQARFPNRPLRFVVPFPPGGTLDPLARAVAGDLGTALGQPVVVENRPGASGVIGAEGVVRAAPDAHTLMIMSNTLVTLPALRADMPFDPLTALMPVIQMGSTPTVLTVHPAFPARTMAQFAEAARRMPGGVSYNSPGIASPPHLAGELLARAGDIPMSHVSYRGTQPAVTDLLGGQVPAMMAPLNAVLPFLREGRLHAIAVTDPARATDLPEVPTMREAGVAAMPAVSSWFGVLTTAGSPPESVARLNAEIARILREPAVVERLRAQSFEIAGGTPEELGRLMREEAARSAAIVRQAGIRME